jgi:peptidoglycan/LPS O-acetylase OafA/YrhL
MRGAREDVSVNYRSCLHSTPLVWSVVLCIVLGLPREAQCVYGWGMGDSSSVSEMEYPVLEVHRMWIRPHYDSFNGIRAIAVLMVFAHHFGGSLQVLTGGTFWVGVDLFFVLSGFLITGILFDSLNEPHYFRNFYIRRALRIFPVFYGFFILLLILTPILHLHFHRNIFTFAFYIGNLIVPFSNAATNNPTLIWIVAGGKDVIVANIGHLWSLCVEEQFYLLWPAVVWIVRDRRALMNLCVALSICVLMCRLYLHARASHIALQQNLLYWSTYTRCDPLLMGGWLALWLRKTRLTVTRLRTTATVLFFIPLMALALGMAHHRGAGLFGNPFLQTWGYSLVMLAAMGTILCSLNDDGAFAKLLKKRWFHRFGAISYGFYFIHGLLVPLSNHLVEARPVLLNVVPFAALLLTTALAWLSFRFYETPFLRLKRVLAPQGQSKTILL